VQVIRSSAQVDDEPRRRSPFVIVGAFLVPFLVVCVLLRLLAPPNPDYAWHPTLTAKWDHLRTTEEHYDIVFVGDSRVFRAIDPSIVEDELAASGCPASVYNLGAVAMTKLEYDRTMEILDDLPGGTPEVVVTVDALTLLVGLEKDFSVRHRGLLSADQASESLEYVRDLPTEFGVGFGNQVDLAAGFAVNQIPQGAIFTRLFQADSQLDEQRLVGPQRGYQPWSEFWEEAGPNGRENLFATLAPELENGGWERRWADEEPTEAEIDRWIATLDAHDREVPDSALPVHMFIPSYYDAGTTSAVTAAWRERRPGVPIVDLVDESMVGDYSDPGFFIDYWHLSQMGSEEVSRAAGQQLCPIVRERLGR
jgi:hypothetical protein